MKVSSSGQKIFFFLCGCVIKPPCKSSSLQKGILATNSYSSVYQHEIEWFDGESTLEGVINGLKEVVRNAVRIYVRGYQKQYFLENILSRQIINLEEYSCPSFKNLPRVNEHFYFYHCKKREYFACAVEFAYKIRIWLMKTLHSPIATSRDGADAQQLQNLDDLCAKMKNFKSSYSTETTRTHVTPTPRLLPQTGPSEKRVGISLSTKTNTQASRMNSPQLQQALRHIPAQTLGVFPANKIPIVLTRPCALVANVDESHNPGSHWVAIYIDKNGHGVFFDSYGLPPSVPHHINRLRRNCVVYERNIKQLQCLDSDVCGQYCIDFLLYMCKDYSLNMFCTLFTYNQRVNDVLSVSMYSNIINNKKLLHKKITCNHHKSAVILNL